MEAKIKALLCTEYIKVQHLFFETESYSAKSHFLFAHKTSLRCNCISAKKENSFEDSYCVTTGNQTHTNIMVSENKRIFIWSVSYFCIY